MKQTLSLLFVVCVLAGSRSVEAQILTGRVLGVVQDESGALLLGITATLESPASPGGPIAVLTNERGTCRFTQLQPGVYQLNGRALRVPLARRTGSASERGRHHRADDQVGRGSVMG